MNEDETLDKVIALWAEADKHSDEAAVLLDRSQNEEKMSDDLEHEAEEMWKPLAAAHPEWFDDLLSGIDPRTISHDDVEEE